MFDKIPEELDKAYNTIHSSKFERFPHCDPKILHRPNTCNACDMYPEWQALRVIWNMNFTNESLDKKTQCPAEQARPRNIVNRWFGNKEWNQ